MTDHHGHHISVNDERISVKNFSNAMIVKNVHCMLSARKNEEPRLTFHVKRITAIIGEGAEANQSVHVEGLCRLEIS